MTAGPDNLNERLSAFLDGELPGDEAAELEKRLAAEPALRLELEQLAKVKQLVGGLERVQAPPAIRAGVLAQLERRSLLAPAHGVGQPGRWWAPLVRVAAAAATLLLVAALGVIVWQHLGAPGGEISQTPAPLDLGDKVAGGWVEAGRRDVLDRPVPPRPGGSPMERMAGAKAFDGTDKDRELAEVAATLAPLVPPPAALPPVALKPESAGPESGLRYSGKGLGPRKEMASAEPRGGAGAGGGLAKSFDASDKMAAAGEFRKADSLDRQLGQRAFRAEDLKNIDHLQEAVVVDVPVNDARQLVRVSGDLRNLLANNSVLPVEEFTRNQTVQANQQQFYVRNTGSQASQANQAGQSRQISQAKVQQRVDAASRENYVIWMKPEVAAQVIAKAEDESQGQATVQVLDAESARGLLEFQSVQQRDATVNSGRVGGQGQIASKTGPAQAGSAVAPQMTPKWEPAKAVAPGGQASGQQLAKLDDLDRRQAPMKSRQGEIQGRVAGPTLTPRAESPPPGEVVVQRDEGAKLTADETVPSRTPAPAIAKPPGPSAAGPAAAPKEPAPDVAQPAPLVVRSLPAVAPAAPPVTRQPTPAEIVPPARPARAAAPTPVVAATPAEPSIQHDTAKIAQPENRPPAGSTEIPRPLVRSGQPPTPGEPEAPRPSTPALLPPPSMAQAAPADTAAAAAAGPAAGKIGEGSPGGQTTGQLKVEQISPKVASAQAEQPAAPHGTTLAKAYAYSQPLAAPTTQPESPADRQQAQLGQAGQWAGERAGQQQVDQHRRTAEEQWVSVAVNIYVPQPATGASEGGADAGRRAAPAATQPEQRLLNVLETTRPAQE